VYHYIGTALTGSDPTTGAQLVSDTGVGTDGCEYQYDAPPIPAGVAHVVVGFESSAGNMLFTGLPS